MAWHHSSGYLQNYLLGPGEAAGLFPPGGYVVEQCGCLRSHGSAGLRIGSLVLAGSGHMHIMQARDAAEEKRFPV